MMEKSFPNSHKKILYAIAGGAFLLRLGVLVVGRTYWYKEFGPAWGWEVGWISRSLAQNFGFASPFRGPSPWGGSEPGPTAWIPPLYPSLQPLVFKVFGIHSPASSFVI